MVVHFREINFAVHGVEGSFLTNDVMQILMANNTVFQVVLENQNMIFDLYTTTFENPT